MREKFCCGGQKSKKVTPKVSAPLHLILQAPPSASHEWKKLSNNEGGASSKSTTKLCQLCHLSVGGGEGVKCKDCGLSAHSHCSSHYIPSTTGSNTLFEPRIKKLLSINIPQNNTISEGIVNNNSNNIGGGHSGQSDNTSTRLSSFSSSTLLPIVGEGTRTISAVSGTDFCRSGSKTPEITITPGSEEGVEEENRKRRSEGDSGLGFTSSLHLDENCKNNYIEYVDGPLDGALYALVKPIAKNNNIKNIPSSSSSNIKNTYISVAQNSSSSADSGISSSVTVDQMKDLDRLLNALVEDAESIPDIPYHARQDSLPFSYGIPPSSSSLRSRLTPTQNSNQSEPSSHFNNKSEPSSHFHPNQSGATSNFNNQSEPASHFHTNQSERSARFNNQSEPSSHFHPNQSGSSSHFNNQSEPSSHFHNNQSERSARFNSQSGTPYSFNSQSESSPNYNNRQSASSYNYKSQLEPSQSYNKSQSGEKSVFKSQSGSFNLTPRLHNIELELVDGSEGSDASSNINRGYGRSYSWENGSNNVGRRLRSQSADGRKWERTEGADEWLERQKQRLEEKKTRKFSGNNSLRSDWLAELKQTLPNTESPSDFQTPFYKNSQNYSNYSPVVNNSISNSEHLANYSQLSSPQYASSSKYINSSPSKNHFDNSSSYEGRNLQSHSSNFQNSHNFNSLHNFTSSPSTHSFNSRPSRVPSRSNASTPAWYSSDEDEVDKEVELIQIPISIDQHQTVSSYEPKYRFNNESNAPTTRGRRIERNFSDSAYDRRRDKRGLNSNYETYNSNLPSFPTCPPTPYLNRPSSPGKPPRSPKFNRRGNPTPTLELHAETPRTQTPVNPKPVFLTESNVKFTRDLSSYWYRPNASREETISALRFASNGSFIIRNSNSFPGAFGLAIKVDERTNGEESVRHFLIEPTKYGVRLRGSPVEPVFSSLSALVYAHSIEPLALPSVLTLPNADSVLPTSQSQSTTAQLLSQGAACQLLFLGVVGVECISGSEAILRGVSNISLSKPTLVSLRLSKQGLTLTDIHRQRFFRLHFPLHGISYAAMDPSNRSLTHEGSDRRIFGIVARLPSAPENSCIVLSEYEEGQPGNAIVAFIQRVIDWQS